MLTGFPFIKKYAWFTNCLDWLLVFANPNRKTTLSSLFSRDLISSSDTFSTLCILSSDSVTYLLNCFSDNPYNLFKVCFSCKDFLYSEAALVLFFLSPPCPSAPDFLANGSFALGDDFGDDGLKFSAIYVEIPNYKHQITKVWET